jgi:hypothetical protein
MGMGLSPVGASHLPYLRTVVAWSAPSGLNLRCGRVPRALPWAGMKCPLGAEYHGPSLLHRSRKVGEGSGFSRAPGCGRTYRNATCRRGSHSDPAGTRRIAWRAALSKTVSLSTRRGRRGGRIGAREPGVPQAPQHWDSAWRQLPGRNPSRRLAGRCRFTGARSVAWRRPCRQCCGMISGCFSYLK